MATLSLRMVLREARRIHYHAPKDKSLSWYEGVAVSGLRDDSRISGKVEQKVIVESYSLTSVSEIAKESLESHVAHTS